MGLYVQEFLTEAELANYKYPETSEIIETDAPTQPVTTKAETTKAETKPADPKTDAAPRLPRLPLPPRLPKPLQLPKRRAAEVLSVAAQLL